MVVVCNRTMNDIDLGLLRNLKTTSIILQEFIIINLLIDWLTDWLIIKSTDLLHVYPLIQLRADLLTYSMKLTNQWN